MSEFVCVASTAGMLYLPPDAVVCQPLDVERLADHGRLDLSPDEVAGSGADDTVEAIAAARRLRARADALEVEAIARLDGLREGSRYVPDEVAPELRVTRFHADTRVARAVDLTTRWPRLVAAMGRGEIEAYWAGRIADAAKGLADDLAREVDTRLAAKLAEGTLSWLDPTKLVRAARRLVIKLDPAAQAAKAKHARRNRGVFLGPEDDSMATLAAVLPAEVASAAYARVDGIAHALRNRGDDRNLEQLRADVYADLLLGHDPGAVAPAGAATVYLHVPIDTALSISDHGAELSGYGPIPGPIAREIMTNPKSTWRLALTEPRTGTVHDLGRSRYRPTQAIRELIIARDRECSHCHRPARYCDVDHERPWSEGGTTSVVNLGPHCEPDHYRKDHPDWTLRYDPVTGVATTITPTGRTYRQRNQPIIDPEPDPPPRLLARPGKDGDIGETPLILPESAG